MGYQIHYYCPHCGKYQWLFSFTPALTDEWTCPSCRKIMFIDELAIGAVWASSFGFWGMMIAPPLMFAGTIRNMGISMQQFTIACLASLLMMFMGFIVGALVGSMVGTYLSSILRSNARKADPKKVKLLLERARAKEAKQSIHERVAFEARRDGTVPAAVIPEDGDYDETGRRPTRPTKGIRAWMVAAAASACLLVMVLGNLVAAVAVEALQGERRRDAAANDLEPAPAVAPALPLDKQAEELGAVQYLAALPEFEVKSGPWRFSKGGTGADGNMPISVNGVTSSRGLGMHPPDKGFAAASWHLNGKYSTFKSAVALNDSATLVNSKAVFEVLGDGKSLWRSTPIGKARQWQACVLDVGGVNVLELRVHSQGSHFGLHAVWVEPRVIPR
jgi:hypothetical protein